MLTRRGMAHRFLGMGVKPERIVINTRAGLRKELFNPQAEALDAEKLVAEVAWSPDRRS